MHQYLKNHIIEELEGAVDYWTTAIDFKNTPIGYTFKDMAETEIEHANSLLKIFNKIESHNYHKEEEMYKEILDAYSDAMYKIENMKRLYWKEDE